MHYEALIRGETGEWAVKVPTKKQADAMIRDGIEVIEVHNSIPVWVLDMGLARIWCIAQDIWHIPTRWFNR